MAIAGVLTRFWQPTTDGVSVTVKVQPRSRRPGLRSGSVAADGPRLRIGVTEPAEAGRANRAACAALAKALGVPGSAVRIVTGSGSRDKRLEVTGDPAVLAPRLTAL